MMNSISIRKPWVPVSEQDRLEVKEELDRVLASPLFGNSKRYPSLLRHVVERTLSGEADQLKERTLGIEVFHRTADYDTNADPVVRFSASEVRRRLAQFYQERTGNGLIEICLPVGSYVPQFSLAAPSSDEQSPSVDVPGPPPDKVKDIRDHQHGVVQTVERQEEEQPPSRFHSRAGFLPGLLAGFLFASALTVTGYFVVPTIFEHHARGPVMQLWGPLLAKPDRVLISAGRTHVEETDTPEPPNATIEQHILRPEARLSFSAVQAISQVAGLLQTQHKQFRIHEAYSNNLQDLHGLPVVLISGYNNIWTMRLLRKFRFHFDQIGSLHYIVDAEHPERRDWSVDFDTPYMQQTTDYAIVGRFYDATTGGPVAVVAGIGSNGSQAAGDFIVSPDALESLARLAPHHTLDANFEAVLKVEVIGGNTGAATIVASSFW